MPKTYITQKQRDGELLNRIIKKRMGFQGVKQADLAKRLGMSAQVLCYKLKNYSLTATDLLAIDRILAFEPEDLNTIFRKGKNGNITKDY